MNFFLKSFCAWGFGLQNIMYNAYSS